VAESCNICSSSSKRPVRKLFDTASYEVLVKFRCYMSAQVHNTKWGGAVRVNWGKRCRKADSYAADSRGGFKPMASCASAKCDRLFEGKSRCLL